MNIDVRHLFARGKPLCFSAIISTFEPSEEGDGLDQSEYRSNTGEQTKAN